MTMITDNKDNISIRETCRLRWDTSDMKTHYVLCILVIYLCGSSDCWIFNVKPGEYVCTPLNFLCSYSEQCCMGVCYSRTFFKYIKIRLCTLGNKIIGFPKEEELNYIGTKDMRKLVHDRSTEKGHIKGDIERAYDKENEQNSEQIDPEVIYKPVDIPLATEAPDVTECTECKEKTLQELAKKINFKMLKVDKQSPMYGGPLNFTGNFSVPYDNIHQPFFVPCNDCGQNKTKPDLVTEKVRTLFGYDVNHAGGGITGNSSTKVQSPREKYNLTGEELKEFEGFDDLTFLKPETVTVSDETKATGIKENLESFFRNEAEEE